MLAFSFMTHAFKPGDATSALRAAYDSALDAISELQETAANGRLNTVKRLMKTMDYEGVEKDRELLNSLYGDYECNNGTEWIKDSQILGMIDRDRTLLGSGAVADNVIAFRMTR